MELDVLILGGGQLSQMLVKAGKSLALKMGVIANDASDCALLAKPHEHLALQTWTGPDSIAKLEHFAERARVITIESEFTSLEVFENCPQLSRKMLPSPKALRVAQSKWNQKVLFESLGLPTAKAVLSEEGASLASGKILKWDRLGYDGKGVLKSDSAQVPAFLEQARTRGTRVLSEDLIDFQMELAIVSVRKQSGEVSDYPLVVSVQKDGICFKVDGPATAFGVDKKYESLAQEYAKAIGDKLNLVGAFALELFLTSDGKLLINELAPRVHNSGHYSQDFGGASQFENHLRAILNMELGNTTPTCKTFGMVNILGDESNKNGLIKAPAGAIVHWYGKSWKPGRKLGHWNTITK